MLPYSSSGLVRRLLRSYKKRRPAAKSTANSPSELPYRTSVSPLSRIHVFFYCFDASWLEVGRMGVIWGLDGFEGVGWHFEDGVTIGLVC